MNATSVSSKMQIDALLSSPQETSEQEEPSTSSTKPSTSEFPSMPTELPLMVTDLSSSAPMMVRVSLLALSDALQARRKQLVKLRRNHMAKAAATRRRLSGAVGKVYSNEDTQAAEATLGTIRVIDNQLGLLKMAANQRSHYFDVDVRDPELGELGFGLDTNGNSPAL